MGMGVPPFGIPITDDIQKLYPPEIQKAWRIFDCWWGKNFDGANQVSRSKMSSKVSEALKQITETPIPGCDGLTGEDSCYVVSVNNFLTD
jgi:hypothetical protein